MSKDLYEHTLAAQRSVESARMEASLRGNPEVLPEHLLVGVLDSGSERVLRALSALGVDPGVLRDVLRWGLPDDSGSRTQAAQKPRLGADASRILRYAATEAEHLGDEKVDALHLLLGSLYETQGNVREVLEEANISLSRLREHALERVTRSARSAKKGSSAGGLGIGALPRFFPSPIFLALVGVTVASGLALFLGAPGEAALTVLFVLGGWTTSVCLHEFGHALAAYLGGDTSVEEKGYLTLNPLRYTHPLLSIVMPVGLLLLGGIPFPGGAVYVERDALRSRRWDTIVSAAGPAATLLIAVLISVPFLAGWHDTATQQTGPFWSALALLALLKVVSLLFNLLPIPPLDGFGMVAPWLDRDVQRTIYGYSNLAFLLIFFVMMQDTPVSRGFWQGSYRVADVFHIPLDWAYYAMQSMPSLSNLLF